MDKNDLNRIPFVLIWGIVGGALVAYTETLPLFNAVMMVIVIFGITFIEHHKNSLPPDRSEINSREIVRLQGKQKYLLNSRKTGVLFGGFFPGVEVIKDLYYGKPIPEGFGVGLLIGEIFVIFLPLFIGIEFRRSNEQRFSKSQTAENH